MLWVRIMTVISNAHTDLIDAGQDQTVIGRAAVAAARMSEEGRAPSKFWVVESSDILKYGRDEWKV